MVVLLNIFLHFYLLINLSVRSFFLCCRDSPKLLYMVSKNSDKLHNSSWGPQEKRLFLKHSLNIKENPYKPINTVQKYLLQITYWYVFIRHNSKDFHYRQIKHEKSNPLFMTVTCSITITPCSKWKDTAQKFLPFIVHTKKKILWETHSPPNFLWHSRKFLPCCIRHSWLKISKGKKKNGLIAIFSILPS